MNKKNRVFVKKYITEQCAISVYKDISVAENSQYLQEIFNIGE